MAANERKKSRPDTTGSSSMQQYTIDDFAQAYRELCLRMGFQIAVNPVWTPTNHGTWEVTLQSSVMPLQIEGENAEQQQ